MKTIQNSLTSVQLFWLCAGVYMLAWIIVPMFAIANVPIDTLEGYAWGHEWPLGTYKHPPLAAWILEALAVLTNRAAWAHFLANQLAVIATFWAVWQTGRRIVSETGAVIGALLLAAIPYYNIIIPEFNPNVLQLPFWALIGWSFHKAVKDDRMIDWLLLGLWSAASLYAKYSSALQLVSLTGLMLYHPEARKRLASKGPWLTVLTTVILLLPHIVWLFENDFMPFTYAASRFEHLPYGPAFLVVPALFIFWQAATLLPALLLYGISFGIPSKTKTASSFDGMFLCCVTFGPALITCLIAAVSGGVIRTMWATPFWNFIGLWAVFYFQPDFSSKNFRRFIGLWSFIFIAGLVGFFSIEALGPYVTHKAKRINFSGQRFAEQISKIWHQRYHQPLRYVVGDTWIGGNIAYYAGDRPHLLTDGDYKISPWVTPQEIKKHGGIIVWCGTHCDIQDQGGRQDQVPTPAYIHTAFPQAEIQPPMIFPQKIGAPVPSAMVEWAVVPPQGMEEAP